MFPYDLSAYTSCWLVACKAYSEIVSFLLPGVWCDVIVQACVVCAAIISAEWLCVLSWFAASCVWHLKPSNRLRRLNQFRNLKWWRHVVCQKTDTLRIQSFVLSPRTETAVHTRFVMLAVFTSGHFIVRERRFFAWSNRLYRYRSLWRSCWKNWTITCR